MALLAAQAWGALGPTSQGNPRSLLGGCISGDQNSETARARRGLAWDACSADIVLKVIILSLPSCSGRDVRWGRGAVQHALGLGASAGAQPAGPHLLDGVPGPRLQVGSQALTLGISLCPEETTLTTNYKQQPDGSEEAVEERESFTYVVNKEPPHFALSPTNPPVALRVTVSWPPPSCKSIMSPLPRLPGGSRKK